MTDLRAVWAANPHRWHSSTSPRLRNSVDPVQSHMCRVAQIIFALHPAPSIGLIHAALHHDTAEDVTGDVPGPAKRAHPALAAALDAVESAVLQARGVHIWINDDDSAWLRLADMLDALWWAELTDPVAVHGNGWPEQRAAIRALGWRLGVGSEVEAATREVRG